MRWLDQPIPVTPVINLSGPATIWGTSQSSPAVGEAVAHALAHHWDMAAVARWAGETIARWSGAEAGAVTNCSAAGITLTVAACMTGADPGRIAQLPDATGMPRDVVIARGHVVHYGASIEQMIRLAGATVHEIGSVNRTVESDLTHALGPDTAAAMYVISHHTVQYGVVPLERFVALCHERGVPVIVDAAAQDMQIARIVASGADLVVISGQKYLSGPTAGIVCGRADLVAAVDAQVGGIGRTMKVGKDGYFGTIAALEERMALDLASWAQVQKARADRLAAGLQGLSGATVSVRKDRGGQPVHRVEVVIDPAVAGIDAAGVCAALRACTPSIKPRAYQVDEGWFALEPVHVTEDELAYVIRELRWILGASDPTLPPAAAPHS
jgi:D-glucosaminate-6-phosphate ammonia-lyase